VSLGIARAVQSRRNIRLNAEAAGQLAQLEYEISSAGKIQIVGKDVLKRRGIKSLDRAELLMLSFAHDPKNDKNPPPLSQHPGMIVSG